MAGQDYLFAFDDAGNGSAFRVGAKAPWIEPVASKLSLRGPADIVEPFIIGMNPHLLAYRGTGDDVIPSHRQRSVQPAYTFACKRRRRRPGSR